MRTEKFLTPFLIFYQIRDRLEITSLKFQLLKVNTKKVYFSKTYFFPEFLTKIEIKKRVQGGPL